MTSIDTKQKRDAYVYNTIGSILNSFQTTILLLFITRLGNVQDSSIFVIAYAIANLMLTIGKFGVRNFQVTDVKNTYTFSDYFVFRMITCLCMIVFSIIYICYGIICNNYDMFKIVAIVIICFLKLVEAFEDVIHGELQRQNRLDIAAKIYATRQIVYLGLFIISYFINNNMIFSLLLATTSTTILGIILNKKASKLIIFSKISISKSSVRKLLHNVYPLAIVTFLLMYLGNAPKYIVDGIISDANQTNLNIIFMPVFVISLLSSFIYNPILNDLSRLWNSNKVKEFDAVIKRQVLIIFGFTILIIIGGDIIGIRLLEILYGVNLSDMYKEFNILMICGGGLALNNVFNIVMTVIRKQKSLMAVFAFSALSMFLFGRYFLLNFSLIGLCIFFAFVIIFSNCMLLLICIINRKRDY